MSNCGNCRNPGCTCGFIGDGVTAQVLGIGSLPDPFSVRPISPSSRPVGFVRRTTSQNITLNTDTAIIFQQDDTPIAPVDMWSPVLPTRLTAPIAGLYLVGGFSALSVGIVNNWIAKNGIAATPQVKRTTTPQVDAYRTFNDVCTLIRLNAGEYIELYVRTTVSTTTGTTFTPVLSGAGITPIMWANWMGP